MFFLSLPNFFGPDGAASLLMLKSVHRYGRKGGEGHQRYVSRQGSTHTGCNAAISENEYRENNERDNWLVVLLFGDGPALVLVLVHRQGRKGGEGHRHHVGRQGVS